jgi:hypothetical protein
MKYAWRAFWEIQALVVAVAMGGAIEAGAFWWAVGGGIIGIVCLALSWITLEWVKEAT